MTVPHIELLWFEDCPNDEATGTRLRFPGSPTVRIDGVDVEPGWEWSGDGTPRCRLYATSQGLRGIPEASWIDARLRDALGGVDSSGGDR